MNEIDRLYADRLAADAVWRAEIVKVHGRYIKAMRSSYRTGKPGTPIHNAFIAYRAALHAWRSAWSRAKWYAEHK